MRRQLLDHRGMNDMARFVDKWWPDSVTRARRPLRGIVVLSRLLSNSELLDFTDFIGELPAGGAWVEVLKGRTPNGLPIRIFLNPMRCCSIEVRFQFVPSDADNRLTIIQSREDHDEIFVEKMRGNLELLSKSEYYTVDFEALKAGAMLGCITDQNQRRF